MSRPATVIVGAPAQPNQTPGVAVRITQGSVRGPSIVWDTAPCVVRVVGSFILVEAVLTNVPYKFGPSGPAVAAALTPPATGVVVSANIIEGHGEPPNPTLLASFAKPKTSGIGLSPIVAGPVRITDVVLKNTHATAAVQIIFGDAFASAFFTNPAGVASSIIVPPASAVGIGPDALGAFWLGFCAYAVLDLTNAPAYGGLDANGTSVVMDVWGNYITSGQ